LGKGRGDELGRVLPRSTWDLRRGNETLRFDLLRVPPGDVGMGEAMAQSL
jgi:hypothetical protein